jgi:hypothetical protein
LTLRLPGEIVGAAVILTFWLPATEPEPSVWFEPSTDQWEKLTMKVSTIALATVLVLSSGSAMAQSANNSFDEIAASPALRSAMNSMHRVRYNRGWSSSRYNGHGINSLGVTTNQGRKYNGG